MNQKARKTLEYDKIAELLAGFAGSAGAKEKCRGISPLTDLPMIEQMQSETADALSCLFRKGSISFGSVTDVRASLRRASIGASLSTRELLAVRKLLGNTANVIRYLKSDRDDAQADTLTGYASLLDPVRRLSDEIERVILSEDAISDDASSALRSIRRSIRLAEERIRSELSRIIASGADYLQDSLITTRDGRYCIPVKAGYKSQVNGIVHDTSGSGSTYFIEPASVVKLNNEIRELEVREKAEIERILQELSAQTAECAPAIETDFTAMTELDFIFARAHLAMEQNAARPHFSSQGILDLKKARHPLIDRNRVVPIDIRLGGDFRMLIITGPNTGGKTVTLKTTGLLAMMGQSGLHIPASEQSVLPVFREIFADIGDEQSIEQSLSTFSAHMTNIISFLDLADEDSLLLFDELGSGTDPVEGAALAISILTELNDRHVRTVATTHYSELKQFALRTEGVVNGACEFDVETLSPTYRLLIGVPGKSNAFSIVQKLGMRESLIEKARAQIDEKDVSFEEIISGLEDKRRELEKERLALAEANRVVAQLKEDLEKRKEKLAAKRTTLVDEANEEAKRILQEAKDFADETIRWYTKHGGASVSELEKRRTRVREKIRSHEAKQALPAEKPSGSLKPSDLAIGDSVHVISMGLDGTVHSLPDAKGNLFVTMGIMRSKVSLKDLKKLETADVSAPNVESAGSGKLKLSKSFTVSPEINLLGKTVDEAVAELDKYLDDAYLSHLPSVRIVHGKGTGALRRGVHDYLKKQKHVRSYHLAEYGEGDSGVTIAEFRN